jgi:hypothetical protein
MVLSGQPNRLAWLATCMAVEILPDRTKRPAARREVADLDHCLRLSPVLFVERVTITVRSNIGDEGTLTVQDALRQVLDFFDLLTDAIKPGVPVDVIAHRGKESLKAAIRNLTSGQRPPSWMDRSARAKARSILQRNVNGVGRTDIRFDDQSPVEIIVEKTARAGLLTLEKADIEQAEAELDLSHRENGSVEGELIDATTHYGAPAIRIRERLTKAEVTCAISRDLASRVGQLHNWEEVWAGKRVLVVGEITYNKDGGIGRVLATDILTVEPEPLRFEDIANPNFTRGRSIADHLAELWSGEDG